MPLDVILLSGIIFRLSVDASLTQTAPLLWAMGALDRRVDEGGPATVFGTEASTQAFCHIHHLRMVAR